MKRILISICCGIAFPILYSAGALLMVSQFPDYFRGEMLLFGESVPVPGPIYLPTLFPIHFNLWLQANSFFGLGEILDTRFFRSVTLISVFALYFTLSYVLLSVLKFPRSKNVVYSPEPPQPPVF